MNPEHQPNHQMQAPATTLMQSQSTAAPKQREPLGHAALGGVLSKKVSEVMEEEDEEL